VLPIPKSKTVVVWSTTEINDESHDQETDDCDDLDTGEDEFGFTIDGNGEDVEADDEDNDDRDPYCDADVVCTWPVANNNRSGGDFGTEGDCRRIPVLFDHKSVQVIRRRSGYSKRSWQMSR
jgi:hypothetical protein